MLARSGYRPLPLGDFDRFQQSSLGFLGSQKGCLFPEPGGVQTEADAPQTWPSCICHGFISFLGFLLLLITFPISGWFALKIVPTYERMIVFRLGRIRTPQGPGVVLLLPCIDSFHRVDLRTRAFNVPPCKLASKDGAVLSVGADVQFRIWDPVLSVMTVKDLNAATRMTAQNALTKALLRRPLRDIQMEKLKISEQLLANAHAHDHAGTHQRSGFSTASRRPPCRRTSGCEPPRASPWGPVVAPCSSQRCAPPALEINDVTRAWGLEVDRMELAVEAVLQPPQDSLAGPSLDDSLQQLALHFLGGGMSAGAGGALPPGPDTVEMVDEVELPVGAGAGSKQPVAEGLLTALQPFLSEALVSHVGACFQFNVIVPGGTQSTYFLDLTAGQGRVGHGVPDGTPDVVVEMTEADLRALLFRELRPLGAYMSGRLKVKGDLAMAMKLEAVLSALK
ncbi:stomatin-like protein 1 isoform X2 [Rhinolophus ferrumequinum]|uniref:stomatin-like protein 1 isoform X2 n=1 Tax=Rhinolophus ferrumequinum TaxID=59479 RepID=UPI00140F5B3B|nr:stomatin-like protein 1 isoform X2 [Rhinolophus ferrumequinum]